MYVYIKLVFIFLEKIMGDNKRYNKRYNILFIIWVIVIIFWLSFLFKKDFSSIKCENNHQGCKGLLAMEPYSCLKKIEKQTEKKQKDCLIRIKNENTLKSFIEAQCSCFSYIKYDMNDNIDINKSLNALKKLEN